MLLQLIRFSEEEDSHADCNADSNDNCHANCHADGDSNSALFYERFTQQPRDGV